MIFGSSESNSEQKLRIGNRQPMFGIYFLITTQAALYPPSDLINFPNSSSISSACFIDDWNSTGGILPVSDAR